MEKSFYSHLVKAKFAKCGILLLLTFIFGAAAIQAQTVRVTGDENNVNISKVVLSVESGLIEQTSPAGNENPAPEDEPVLIQSILLENGDELLVTTRKPEVTNPHPSLGTEEISESQVEIIRSNQSRVSHRHADFLPALQEVVSTPDLRSYWSINSQPSIPAGEKFVDLRYPIPSSGYILFSERNGNSGVDFVPLGLDGKPIPGATTVQVRGYQWNTGVNHPIDNPSQKQWLVIFSPSLFNTLLPVDGVRVISINEPDGKLVFFVGTVSAAPDYSGPVSNLQESKAVVNVFENDELNGGSVQPFDVNLSVITPFPENTVVFNEDGTVDVPAGTPPGTYTMTYQITEKVGGETDQATVTVRVYEQMPEANDDNVSHNTVDAAEALINVLDNDLLNGQPATLDNVVLSEVSNTSSGVLTLNADGSLDIAPGAQAGVYQLVYQICDKADGSKCDTATVSAFLDYSQLEAVDDNFGKYLQNGYLGNVLLNDKINGIPLGPNQVDIAIVDNGGLTDLEVEANGMLRLPGTAAAGSYVLTYELTEKADPSNKDTAEVRFSIPHTAVTPNNDFAQTDQNQSVDIAVLENDSSESGSLNLNSLRVNTPPSNGTVTINGDGTLNYTPDVNFSGEDSFTYNICDEADATACGIATVTVTVRPILMDLVKTPDKERLSPGETITYTIELSNNSAFEVSDIVIEDPLPDNFQYVSSSLSPSAEGIWQIAALAPGSSISLSIEAIAVSSGEVVNTVLVRVGEYQISTESDPVTIVSQVDLSISKSSLGAEIYQGNEFEYQITVNNVGDSEARDVLITDNLPAGISYVSSGFDGAADVVSAVNGPTISWTVPAIPAGGQLTISLVVKADQIGAILNQVEVAAADQEELTPENNQDQDSNEVLGLFIPNVITPGSRDNRNDLFVIKGIEKFASTKLVIFNRWGDHVFEAEDYANSWAAEGLSAGAYYYVLEVADSNGKKQTFRGWIQVIKD